MSQERSVTRRIYLAGVILFGLAWLGFVLAGGAFVSGVLDGRFLPYLGQLIRFHMTNNPDHVDPAFYSSMLAAAGGRALLLWLVVGGAVLYAQTRRTNILGDFVSAPDHAANLAVTRIVIFLVIFFAVDPATIHEFASRPVGLREAPNLMGWWITLFPVTPDLAVSAAWILKTACLLAAAGVFTRVTGPVAVILTVYVLGIPNYFGKVNHSYHAIVWFAMILSVSPCADALSVDAWRRRSAEPRPSAKYGFPLRLIWLLFAVAYFFPGAWKFILSGWDWAFSENLKFKMYSAWLNAEYIPTWRIDRYPFMYQSMAALSLLWEIAFPLLILFRRTRVPALAVGLGFHWGVYEFMHIGPFAIPWGYVAFLDWRRIVGANHYSPLQEKDQPSDLADDDSPLPATKWIGFATLIIATVFGALLINSWPFSVYPTHAGIRGPTHQSLEMVMVDADGNETRVDLTTVAPTSLQGIDFNAFGSGDLEAYCRALAESWLSRRDRQPTAALRFYRTIRQLAPEAYSDPPIVRELLLQFAP